MLKLADYAFAAPEGELHRQAAVRTDLAKAARLEDRPPFRQQHGP
jgi:hypothetical protein